MPDFKRGAAVDVRSPYNADHWFEEYFVLRVEGDRALVAKHYLSEGQLGVASRLCTPTWKDLGDLRERKKKISTRLCESVEWLLRTEERWWESDRRFCPPRQVNRWQPGDWVFYSEDVWWVRQVDGDYLFLHRISHPFGGSFQIGKNIYWVQEWVCIDNAYLRSAESFRQWALRHR